MGSHSKKRKKEKKRSRSRSRSSERYKSSRRRSRTPSRSRSKSPSYSSSSKKKKHHKRSRSRSPSRERYSNSKRSSRSRSRDRSSRRSSRSRSRDRSSRRSSRSRSRDKDRSTKHRRSRSRSRSADRRRRRSRSSDRRSKRSKSREKQKSPDRSSKAASLESNKIKKEEDDREEDLKLNPAEAIHHKMRKAFEAAASADAKLREQGLLSSVKQEPLSRTEQLERDQVLQTLESDSFAPSSFVPNRDRQAQLTYLTKEQTHDNAIFGGVGIPNPALNGAQTYSYGIPITYKKRGQLASKYLAESAEVKEKRWLEKLQAMRKQKMDSNPEYFNKLLTINALTLKGLVVAENTIPSCIGVKLHST